MIKQILWNLIQSVKNYSYVDVQLINNEILHFIRNKLNGKIILNEIENSEITYVINIENNDFIQNLDIIKKYYKDGFVTGNIAVLYRNEFENIKF